MNKFLKTLLISTLAIGGTSLLGACTVGGDDKGDAKLYHLTLSSNLSLSETQKSGLKATYGYGDPSPVVKEGIRPQGEIDDLKKAGATDEDISKAGQRQADGSYFFFASDPMYVEAPSIEGYALDGFYFKGTSNLAYRPILSKGPDQTEYTLNRWEMPSKDTELEAKYKECRYHPYFNNMDEGDTNPNALPESYSFIEHGNIDLLPATSSNPHKHFVTWTYSKYVQDEWKTFEISSLPHDYSEESLRLEAKWEVDKFSIDFDFDFEIEYGNRQPRNWEEVCDTIFIKGNQTTVNGEKTVLDVAGGGPGIEVNKTSEILTPFVSVDGGDPWIEICVTPKEGFKLWNYAIVNGYVDSRYTSTLGSFTLNGSDFSEVISTIKLTFVYDE